MFITYKEAKVYYTVNGSGKPLLLLHGWGGSTQSLLAYENQLVSSRKVINLDFPPFGKSQNPKQSYDVFDYLNIVKNILKKENVGCVDVIAHSFGGRIALLLASENIVDKMVLISSAGIRVDRFKIFIKVKLYKFKKFISKFGFVKQSSLLKHESEDYKNLNQTMRVTFNNIVNFDERKFLKKIKCQTLLIWGRSDSDTPLKIAKVLKRKIKNCDLVTYNGGHFVCTEKFNEIIIVVKYFLKE